MNQRGRRKGSRPQAYHSLWSRLAHHYPDRVFGAILIGGGLLIYSAILMYALS